MNGYRIVAAALLFPSLASAAEWSAGSLAMAEMTTTVAQAQAAAAEIGMPEVLKTVIAGLPRNYKKDEGMSSRTPMKMGDLMFVDGTPWVIAPQTPLFYSWIGVGFWDGGYGLGRYRFASFEFNDAPAAEKMSLLLRLGYRTLARDRYVFFRKGVSFLAVSASDSRGGLDQPLMTWLAPLLESAGYKREEAGCDAKESEQVISHREIVLAPGQSVELPVVFAKDFVATSLGLLGVASNHDSEKITFTLLNPSLEKAAAVFGEKNNWRSEEWLWSRVGTLLPSRAQWKVRLTNNSDFLQARIAGWGVELAGYSCPAAF